MKKTGPLHRNAQNPRYSYAPWCGWKRLDWSHWWQDEYQGTYLHVRCHLVPGEIEADRVWARVVPRPIKGRVCHRVSVQKGQVYWLHDEPRAEAASTCKQP